MALLQTNTSALPATSFLTPSDHRRWATQFEHLHVDLGTGDGKFALQIARRTPGIGVIGVDACLDHLHGPRRRHPANVRFACCDVLEWPLEMIPMADAVTINFPYGSLLRGLFEGDDDLMIRLDALLGSGSRLEIRVNETALIATGLDPERGAQSIVSTLRQIDGLSV